MTSKSQLVIKWRPLFKTSTFSKFGTLKVVFVNVIVHVEFNFS